jgi:hypothetical protein
MRDVYAKLSWAEKHVDDLMALGHDYLQPGGGNERPLGITFDQSRLPQVVATSIVENPVPVEIGLHAGDLVHNARTALDHALAIPSTASGCARHGRRTASTRGSSRRRSDDPARSLPISLSTRETPRSTPASKPSAQPSAG